MRIQSAPQLRPKSSFSQADQAAPVKKTPEQSRAKEELALEWARHQADQVTTDHKLVIDLGDGHRYSVAGTKTASANKAFTAMQQFFTAGVQEVEALINAGPSLALSGASAAVRPLVTNNLPAEVLANIDQWYQPALMATTVGLGLVSFVKNYQHHQALREAGNKLGLIKTAALVATGVSVATSALGLAGAVVGMAAPQYAGFANTAQAVALGGNAVAFGINYLDYFSQRGQTYAPLGDDK